MIAASVLADINRTCEASVAYGAPPVELVPSGLPHLDAAIGGILRGRVIEIHGGEASGKTALALHLARQLGGPVLYIDADHGLSPYILSNQELYLLDVPTLEDAMDACWTAAAGGFAAVVVDTVAALPTREDLRINISSPFQERKNPQSKLMAKALRVLVGHLHQAGCTLILVNQIREIPSVVYGRPDRPTGGKAIGYFASLRLETRRIEPIKADWIDSAKGRREVIGHTMEIGVRKCKYGPPGMRTAVRLIYGEGLAKHEKGADHTA